MVSNDVLKAITEWTSWATKPDVQMYDIALLKIWIKFERFIGELFVSYAVGIPSETGYSPKLKIQFKDEAQFNVFMRDGNKKYVEYIDKIEKLSSHIFQDNPFDVILLNGNIKTAFYQMRAIRNYVAHESVESKHKMITQLGVNENNFRELNDYLKSIDKTTGNSNYTCYVRVIKAIVELLIKDPSV